MKTPCKECPFRKDSTKGWLANYTPESLHRLVVSEISFPCHMTMKTELDITAEGADFHPPCTGAICYTKKAGKLPRRADLRERMNEVTPKDLENILSPQEFIEHHTIKHNVNKNKRNSQKYRV